MHEQQIKDLFELPFFELVRQAYEQHKQFFDSEEMELCTLLSIKTGACPEDCAYCPQSAHYHTGLSKETLLDRNLVVSKAREAKKNGAKRFCMGAAWKTPPRKDFPKVLDMISGVKALGLETCVTLGQLDGELAKQLKLAGLDFYNHNLDTSPKFYPTIISTRSFQDRLETINHIINAGINVCCGGILGMGETRQDRVALLLALYELPTAPKSIPINKLIPIKGTPLENSKPIDNFEFIKTIAVTRLMFPESKIRLSAGREDMADEMQAWCFMAGANSIFIGDKLLTASNPDKQHDSQLLKKLNMRTEKINQAGLLRKREAIRHDEEENNLIHIKGKKGINFSSNDYLGLSKHPKVIKAFANGAQKYGFGSGSSSVVSGYSEIQKELEARFAKWLNVDKTILFNSGYLANIGVITSLSNREATIFSDKFCHASILDGIQLSRAKHYRYQHCAIKHLSQMAQLNKPDMIVTESVFSMEGDIAPIRDIISASSQYKSTIIIDDAHGIGVLGKKGGGICEHANINQTQFTCLIAPLGKAFNGVGAIVAGKENIIETILQFARTCRYTTALPPAICVALNSALNIIMEEDWRRERLKENVRFFIKKANEKGLQIASLDETPIKSIIIGKNDDVIKLQDALLTRGFYVAAIRPPTVSNNTARLRISLNCLHKKEQIIQLLDNI